MITRVGILDGLTPAVAAWLKDINPAAGRALTKAGRLIRTRAVANIQASFQRTGRRRTGTGTRGVQLYKSTSASIQGIRIWHGSGILAAHELGARIPPRTMTPTNRRVLAWGGPRGGPHTHFAREVHLRGFTLVRRPTLIPAYEAEAANVLTLMEAEYQKVLQAAPAARVLR